MNGWPLIIKILNLNFIQDSISDMNENVEQAAIWNQVISTLPNQHFLQTFEWGQVKAKYGWSPIYLVWDKDGKMKEERGFLSSFIFPASAACLVLKRTLLNRGFAKRLSVLYAPKGPLLDWANASLRERVLNDLQAFARKQGAIFLKLDPDVVLGTGIPATDGSTEERGGADLQAELARRGWVYSADQIQFRNSVLIDLQPTEDEMLARMKQKTRYNVRLAEKKGVTVRVGKLEDLGMLYRMYAETSVRDGFVIRAEEYYRDVWGAMMRAGRAQPLIAKADANNSVAEISETNNTLYRVIAVGP